MILFNFSRASKIGIWERIARLFQKRPGYMEHNGLSTFLGELFSPHTHTHSTGKIPHHQSNPGASRTQDDITWRSAPAAASAYRRRRSVLYISRQLFLCRAPYRSFFSLSLSLRPECVVADMRDGSINKRGTLKYLSIWYRTFKLLYVWLYEKKGEGGNDGINYNQIIETSFTGHVLGAFSPPSIQIECV